MQDYGNLADMVKQPDVFVSLAWAGTTVKDRYSIELQTRNKQATLDSIRAAKEMGCKVFVAAGSQAEYGVIDGVITENTSCNPVIAYGKAKLEMLQEAKKLSRELELPYLHLRIFSVFGNGDHPYTLIETAINKMKRNQAVELSSCTQLWNFLYVKDMAYQIVALSQAVVEKRADAGVYNMASDDTRPLKSYLEEMKYVLGASSTLCFGAIQPQRLVSLCPDTTKLRKIIGTLNNYSFEQALLDMKANNGRE